MGKKIRRRPSVSQWLGYAFGMRLPDSMRDWVANDLMGKHAVLRHFLRAMLPFVPVLAGAWFVPGPLWVSAAMSALVFGLAVQYAFYLMPMNRRGRLEQHGLPHSENY